MNRAGIDASSLDPRSLMLTAISPTRSMCSSEPSRRRRDPWRCSSTRSGGPYRPSLCAACVGA